MTEHLSPQVSGFIGQKPLLSADTAVETGGLDQRALPKQKEILKLPHQSKQAYPRLGIPLMTGLRFIKWQIYLE